MFWSLLLCLASFFLPASWSLLTFRAFFICTLDWGKGFTRFHCQVFWARSDDWINYSARSISWFILESSVTSLGVVETAPLSDIWFTRLRWTLGSLSSCPLDPLESSSVQVSDLIFRLLIWIINPCCKPTIEDIQQIVRAKTIYWLSRA